MIVPPVRSAKTADLQEKTGVGWRRWDSNPRIVPAVTACLKTWRLQALLAVTSLAALAPHAHGHAGCHSLTCKERVARKQCTQQRPRRCVDRAILTYRLSAWQAAWMRRVPACESGWNPGATSPGGHMGLYQFASGTWAGLRYARYSPYRAKWAALGAAQMARAGRTGEWSCT